MKYLFFFLFGIIFASTSLGQAPNFTANDIVPPFLGEFGYGTNMGYYPPHYKDEDLATQAAGTPDGAVLGAGVTTIRPALFEHFLDQWGYQIRVDAFQHYENLGLKDNVVFIGFPSDRHRDTVKYCEKGVNESFLGLYEPIWDNGENGTPVNDNNTYALHVWMVVTTYGRYVRFWEIMNEPDLDMMGNGWKPIGKPGNWWENLPEPCEYKLRAPIFHYVRMMRVSYEVAKKVDPTAFVCVGGLGYPSFMDMICRYTDNPDGGKVTPKYPLQGGAYFDVLSYHCYPHIDGSMREWDNDIVGFRYDRHSDAAVAGMLKQKAAFESVLHKYGYNGALYPSKHTIITEINIPRRAYGDFIGSEAAQVNFMIKALVTAQMNDILQIHIYNLADAKPPEKATDEFDYMGLFRNIDGVKPFDAIPNAVATAYRTTASLLRGSKYDVALTKSLRLPKRVGGGAFKDKNGRITMVLWAKTTADNDENVLVNYVLPSSFKATSVVQRAWNFAETDRSRTIKSNKIALSGSPLFFTLP